MFKAERNADFSENPYLRPGDKIEFFRTDRKVSISGSVERPGTYELLKGENFPELLNLYANGAKKTAVLSKLQILRTETGSSKTEGKPLLCAKKIIYLEKNSLEKFPLNDMDSVYIPDQNEIQPCIEAKGVIANPENDKKETDAYDANSYNIYRRKLAFFEAETYASLLRRNRGLFTVFSDLERTYIQRGNEQIFIEADKILDNLNYENNIPVQKEDELIVPYKTLFDDDAKGM